MAGLALLLPFAGCRRGFFSARGSIASEGGELGTWKRTPLGCTRTPFDGVHAGRTTSVATLLWKFGGDPVWRSRQPDSDTLDEPERLELSHTATGPVGSIDTVRSKGAMRLDSAVCSRFELSTHEEPASFPEGRPTLAGHVALDCQVKGSHLTGDVDFRGCTY